MIVVNNQVIRAAIAKRGFREPEPGRLHLFGLRGALPMTSGVYLVENAPNAYNDTLGLFGTDFLLRRGSVDPGATFTVHPMNPEGCAHLVDGAYLYQLGIHKGHHALVQAADVTVWRDRDRDGKPDPGGKTSTGRFGVDIHAGGSGDDVNDWSAGCQIVWGGWTGEPWISFLDTVAAAMHRLHIPTVRYYLLNGTDLIA